MAENPRNLAKILLQWWRKNKRNYPWRREKDPYKILIAELMLQRTKADQVAMVYSHFISRFPNPTALASAQSSEIQNFFRQLGLLWRVKKVKKLGLTLKKRFAGRIPNNREELLSLPGVGEYIADAVLASAFNEKVVAVDMNVCRVVRRLFDLKPRGECKRDPQVRKKVQQMMPENNVKEFNWAMMDFAALVCIPRNPRCRICPLKTKCLFMSRNR